jgi:hypothetical protein
MSESPYSYFHGHGDSWGYDSTRKALIFRQFATISDKFDKGKKQPGCARLLFSSYIPVSRSFLT